MHGGELLNQTIQWQAIKLRLMCQPKQLLQIECGRQFAAHTRFQDGARISLATGPIHITQQPADIMLAKTVALYSQPQQRQRSADQGIIGQRHAQRKIITAWRFCKLGMHGLRLQGVVENSGQSSTQLSQLRHYDG